jgi:hypothetical protein
MGIFKQLKDMKDMVNAAPGLVEQAQQMGAQAQQMAAAQQAAAQARMAQFGGGQPGAFGQQAAPAGPDFEPIDGVTLEQFAAVGKAVAAYNYDGTTVCSPIPPSPSGTTSSTGRADPWASSRACTT